jgi:sporulation protein YlmC with PRC-barrel domain
MSRKVSALAIALLMGSTPIALAAQNTHPNRVAVQEQVIQPNEMRASKMIGSSVYDRQNRDIGKVSDVILGRDAKVDAVIVDVGSFLGMGGKDVAVRPNEIKTDHNRLTLDVTKEQLQQMPKYSLTERNTGAGTSASPVHGGKMGSGR